MTKTHWKRLHNPDYLGAYALDPGKDLIATIRTVGNEMVVGADGKKEECTVMHFVEKIKPMIVNATNAKMMAKLFRTPYIEEWQGRQIQIFADNVKAFGETVEALRIRPFLPKVSAPVGGGLKCTDCGSDVTAFGKMDAAALAEYTRNKYGKAICAACAERIASEATQDKPTDPLSEGCGADADE